MIIMDDAKQVDMNRLSEILEVKRLRFYIRRPIGRNVRFKFRNCFPFFGLVGTNYENMNIYFDQQMLDDYQIQTFHPNDNTKTIFFKMEACFTILKSQGYDYQIIDL